MNKTQFVYSLGFEDRFLEPLFIVFHSRLVSLEHETPNSLVGSESNDLSNTKFASLLLILIFGFKTNGSESQVRDFMDEFSAAALSFLHKVNASLTWHFQSCHAFSQSWRVAVPHQNANKHIVLSFGFI